MNRETYERISYDLINDIFRLYKIKCPRCARARIVRLARYDTEFNGRPYEENLKNRKSMLLRAMNEIAGE